MALKREVVSTFLESSDRSKKSTFLYLFAPMLWSSETWQNSAYKRNSNYGVLYASGHKRKKVQLEMKDSCKATPRDEKQLMKK